MAVPSKVASASSRISAAGMSRWLVGSSRKSRLRGSSRSLASARRLRSPPEKPETRRSGSSPQKRKRARYWRAPSTLRVAAHAADLLDGGLARVERAEVLIEVALVQVGAAADAAHVLRRALPGEELEERRLARPVGPHHADALAAAHQEIDPGEQRPPAALGPEALGVEDDVPAARRRHEAERHLLRRRPDVLRAIERVELLQHLAPALRLLGLLPRDVLADEVLGLGDEPLLPLDELALPGQVLLPGDGVVRVLERVDAEAAAPELHGDGADVVEEGAVVGDDQHGAAQVGEVALQPVDGVEVEVVGRLVEEQQIRRLRQRRAEMEPTALAAREARQRPLQVSVGEAEVLRDHGDPPLQLVAALHVVPIRHLRQPIERGLGAAGRRVLRLRERVPQGQHRGEGAEEGVEHRALGLYLVRLAGIGDAHLPADDDGAGVGRELARDEAEQRGFARPVGRDEGRALPRFQREGEPLKELVGAVAEGEVGDLEDSHVRGVLAWVRPQAQADGGAGVEAPRGDATAARLLLLGARSDWMTPDVDHEDLIARGDVVNDQIRAWHATAHDARAMSHGDVLCPDERDALIHQLCDHAGQRLPGCAARRERFEGAVRLVHQDEVAHASSSTPRKAISSCGSRVTRTALPSIPSALIRAVAAWSASGAVPGEVRAGGACAAAGRSSGGGMMRKPSTPAGSLSLVRSLTPPAAPG